MGRRRIVTGGVSRFLFTVAIFVPGVRNSSSSGGCVAWGRGESAGTGARGECGSREPGRREGSGGLGAGLCGFRQARSQPYLLVSATTFKA